MKITPCKQERNSRLCSFICICLDIYGSIFELGVKAVLEKLTVILKIYLQHVASVALGAVLAVQTKSRNFSTRTLRYGTACYGKSRGPKRVRLTANATVGLEKKLYEDRCLVWCHGSQPATGCRCDAVILKCFGVFLPLSLFSFFKDLYKFL